MNAQPALSTSSVRPGEILAGKYRVDRVLGEGGMGVVVAAHHIQLDTRVAIKFLLPHMLTNADAVARFAREARAAAKITNEHVARVSDVGALESGAPYMVMEYLDGGDLAAWLQQRGRLDVGQAVDFVLQASEAIAEAHKLQIVHRDLKPANLFCIARADGSLCIKVLDFGISKFQDGSAQAVSVTKTTAVMGSPLYMSREQITSSRDVDHRTDIWSLGVILFELLTGKVPFTGETFSEVCVKIATEEPPPLRSLRPDAPEGLEAVIRRCLEKDRDKRFASVGEMAGALAPFAPEHARLSALRLAKMSSSGVDLRISSPSHGGASSLPGMAASDAGLGRTTAGLPRKGGIVVAAIGGVVALLAIGGVVIALRGGGKAADTEPAAAGSQTAATQVASGAPATSATQAVAATATSAALAPIAAPSSPAEATKPSEATKPAAAVGHAAGGGGAPASNAGKPGKPGANPPAATAAAAAPAAKPGVKPGCDPNYYLDENGEKHFKKECF